MKKAKSVSSTPDPITPNFVRSMPEGSPERRAAFEQFCQEILARTAEPVPNKTAQP
jgi:hypothetical protein